MAKGVNGTIDNSTQTTVQRNTQSNRNISSGISSRLGVADELDYDVMFQGSPVNNSELRAQSANSPSDRGDLFDATTGGDVYKSFMKVIDPENGSSSGYLFNQDNPAYLNYTHPQNPFIGAGGSNLDLSSLQTGLSVKLEDDAENISHYRGVPNAIVPDINSPDDGSDSSSTVVISKNENIFGSTSPDYRRITDTSLVTNDIRQSDVYTETIDTLGKYFSRNY